MEGVLHHFPPTEAEGRATADVDSFARIEDWWRTVDDAFLQIDDDQARLARDTEKGCTRRVAEFYGHVWGNDFVAWLQIIRAFSLLFLYAGFLKILVVSRTYVLTTRGRWLSSAFASFLAIVQTGFGEAAWFLVLAIIKKAQDDAPFVLDRGTFASYEGWSFWAFFAAVHFSLLFPSLYLFIEACACCVDERRARFGVWGNAGGDDAENRASKLRRRDAREKTFAASVAISNRSDRATKRTVFYRRRRLRSRETRRRTTTTPLPRAILARFRPSSVWTPGKSPPRDETRGERVVYVERRTAEDAFRSRVRVRKGRSSSYFSKHDT